jgi:hypothetical protein
MILAAASAAARGGVGVGIVARSEVAAERAEERARADARDGRDDAERHGDEVDERRETVGEPERVHRLVCSCVVV